MKRSILAIFIYITGLLTIIFTEHVYRYIFKVLGAEAILGEQSIISYNSEVLYTNPGAMIKLYSVIYLIGGLFIIWGVIFTICTIKKEKHK